VSGRPQGWVRARLSGFLPTTDHLAIRLLDVGVSAFLLVMLLPTFALVTLAIRLESPGGTFFRCRRVGQHGRELYLLKFRKMHADAAGPMLTVLDDRRLTRVGRFLAQWKLDELPQLWSVLRGEMSLVGPRPEDPRFVAVAPEAFREILALRPGITGLSQLAFANETSLLRDADPYRYYVERLLPQKLQLDHLYAQRRSVWLNVKILVWTARVVFFGCSVAVDRQTATLTVRHQRPRPLSTLASLEQAEQSQP
jgi:lipopolysaccharide/colanic/teichoic acid biosynthesis glycosyltransferase